MAGGEGSLSALSRFSGNWRLRSSNSHSHSQYACISLSLAFIAVLAVIMMVSMAQSELRLRLNRMPSGPFSAFHFQNDTQHTHISANDHGLKGNRIATYTREHVTPGLATAPSAANSPLSSQKHSQKQRGELKISWQQQRGRPHRKLGRLGADRDAISLRKPIGSMSSPSVITWHVPRPHFHVVKKSGGRMMSATGKAVRPSVHLRRKNANRRRAIAVLLRRPWCKEDVTPQATFLQSSNFSVYFLDYPFPTQSLFHNPLLSVHGTGPNAVPRSVYAGEISSVTAHISAWREAFALRMPIIIAEARVSLQTLSALSDEFWRFFGGKPTSSNWDVLLPVASNARAYMLSARGVQVTLAAADAHPPGDGRVRNLIRAVQMAYGLRIRTVQVQVSVPESSHEHAGNPQCEKDVEMVGPAVRSNLLPFHPPEHWSVRAFLSAQLLARERAQARHTGKGRKV